MSQNIYNVTHIFLPQMSQIATNYLICQNIIQSKLPKLIIQAMKRLHQSNF